jgi:hypothetical protein
MPCRLILGVQVNGGHRNKCPDMLWTGVVDLTRMYLTRNVF